MNLSHKKVSWRALGAALLGLSLVAAASFSFGAAANHSSAIKTAHAAAITTKHGTIPAGKTPITAALKGSVDWSKLPTVSQKPSAGAAQSVPFRSDVLSPTQRAAYLAGLKSGKIKAPFAVAQPAPAGAAQKPAVPGPNFDACGYTNLPCIAYGFNGLTYNQSGGWIPPDQALATNSSQVLEGANNVFELYNYHGGVVYGPTSSFTFFASLLHSGASLGDPQMFWDATRQHFIIVEIEFVVSGGVTTDYLDIAASKTQNGNLNSSVWYLYQLAANTNNGGAQNWCDYPTLGSDYWGAYITCPDFASASPNPFVGNTIFALNNTALYTGVSASGYFWNNLPIDLGTAYRLSPALEDGTPDAEFLVATDAGYGGPNTNLTTAALTNTRGLVTGSAPTLSYIEQAMPVAYTDGIAVAQQGTSVKLYQGYGTKQVEYKGGNLYLAMTTAVNAGTDDGVWWAEVQPQLSGLNPSNPGAQVVQTTLVRQNNIWAYPTGYDAFMPSFAASDEDDEVLVFNYVNASIGIEPGIAYTGRRSTDPLNTMGDGGNSSLVFGGEFANLSGRWGDYSACSLALNLTTRGLIFCAGEYGGAVTGGNNLGWDTYVYGLQVE